MKLTDEQIDLIANDSHRNVAGGIYATSVYQRKAWRGLAKEPQ